MINYQPFNIQPRQLDRYARHGLIAITRGVLNGNNVIIDTSNLKGLRYVWVNSRKIVLGSNKNIPSDSVLEVAAEDDLRGIAIRNSGWKEGSRGLFKIHKKELELRTAHLTINPVYGSYLNFYI